MAKKTPKKKRAAKKTKKTNGRLRQAQAARMRKKGYLTAKEVSDTYSVGLSTVYQWLDHGHVKGKTIGTARYISEESLIDHLGPDHKLLNP